MSGLLDLVLGAAGVPAHDAVAPRTRLPFELEGSARSGKGLGFAGERAVLASPLPVPGVQDSTAPASGADRAHPRQPSLARSRRSPAVASQPGRSVERSRDDSSSVRPADANTSRESLPGHDVDVAGQRAPARRGRSEATHAARRGPATAAEETAVVSVADPARARATRTSPRADWVLASAQEPPAGPHRSALRTPGPRAPIEVAHTATEDRARLDEAGRGVTAETPVLLQPRPPAPIATGLERMARRAAHGAPAEAPPLLEISIGRIDIEFARPAAPASPVTSRVSTPRRGFEGYGAARRGRLR